MRLLHQPSTLLSYSQPISTAEIPAGLTCLFLFAPVVSLRKRERHRERRGPSRNAFAGTIDMMKIYAYIYIDTRTQTISYMLRKTVCLFETPSSSRLSSSIAEPMDLQRSSFVKRSTSNAAPDIDRPIDRATHRWSSSRDFVENSWVFGEWTSCQRKMVLDVLLLNLVCHVDGIVWQWVVCFSFLPKVR